MTSKEIALLAAKAAEEKKAFDVVVLGLEGITIIADYFVICGGKSNIQVQAIADEIDDKLAEKNVPVLRREGLREGKWILLDYGTVVIHVFQSEEREFYNLERLWSDAKVVYSSKDENSVN